MESPRDKLNLVLAIANYDVEFSKHLREYLYKDIDDLLTILNNVIKIKNDHEYWILYDKYYYLLSSTEIKNKKDVSVASATKEYVDEHIREIIQITRQNMTRVLKHLIYLTQEMKRLLQPKELGLSHYLSVYEGIEINLSKFIK